MKKSKFLRLASALLVIALLTTCAISGTFAKYTSSASGNDFATVAWWSFEVGGNNIASKESQTVTLNLFETRYDDDAVSEEKNVLADYIAPGTSGKFTLTVKNTSAVTAIYKIDLEEKASFEENPLMYSTDGKNWVASIADLSIIDAQLDFGGTEAAHTIYWRWPYDADQDSGDTAIGIEANMTETYVTVTATVTAWQMD